MMIYANSDSYGVLSTGKTYVDFVGEFFGAQVINSGLPGSCNRRIIRTTIRDLLQLKNTPDLVIIGLAHTNRSEYWGSTAVGNDGHFKSFQPNTQAPDSASRFVKGWIETYNDEAANTNLFADIILLTSFLRTRDIRYLIWQGAMTLKPSDFDAPFIHDFYKEVSKDPWVLDMFDFSFSKYCSIIKGYTPYDSDQYGIYGHHIEAAHQDFADYLLEYLK